ncbi:30S ribosomal protein S10 [Mesomycoplasma moatsii]|uniref:30S ribosomal protein S10 n=1 Tax=Mesomycoplasma moatsii TaxID=171287 RepID=UPI0003B48FCB
MEKVNIKLSAYESQLVDQAAIKVIQAIKSIGAKYSGPVPLPTKYEEFTILRSVHINKKSREQFERRTHKRLIVLKDPSKELMEKLQRAELPAGVNIELITRSNNSK